MGLELTDSAKKLLAKKGYDPVLGARPLRRTIQREIEDSLSEQILFDELKAGQIVVVDCEGDPEKVETSTLVFRGADKPAAGTGDGPRRSRSTGHGRLGRGRVTPTNDRAGPGPHGPGPAPSRMP